MPSADSEILMQGEKLILIMKQKFASGNYGKMVYLQSTVNLESR